MQKIVLISLIIVVARVALQNPNIDSELNDVWKLYKTKFGKKYRSSNEAARRKTWESNLKYIQKHNLEYDLGNHTYTLGLNDFADMTNEEFRATYLKTKPNRNKFKTLYSDPVFGPTVTLPNSVDWRTKGYVTDVKHQGQCGSCWSFSATGALEGQHFRKTGSLITFSEQQLIDCSGKYGNNGCNGGMMDNAFEYIQQFGIQNDKSYPYTAEDGTCLYDKSKVVGSCTGYVDIPQGSETSLATAVATIGPISVAIDASNYSFQLYKNGIYNEPECSSTQLDHGVLVVGYGTENGNNYWLVKNSWGTGWGIKGYIKMSKDASNQCGIATMASYPLV